MEDVDFIDCVIVLAIMLIATFIALSRFAEDVSKESAVEALDTMDKLEVIIKE